MALDPATVPFRELVLGNGRKEARSWPALLVGLFSKLRPQNFDRRQTEFIEQQGKACGVD
jgi:hypothetical protein